MIDMLEIWILMKQWRKAETNTAAPAGAACTDVENPPTLNELRFVDAPHVLQNVVVEGLGQLCRHGGVEVRLVAFQYALQRELTHTQDLVVQIHDAFAPRAAVLIFEQPQIQDFVYSTNTQERKKMGKSELIKVNLKLWFLHQHICVSNISVSVCVCLYNHVQDKYFLFRFFLTCFL